jgi:XTP/dITP diphosphohydrolase
VHPPAAPVLVIATTNTGKLREFAELLADAPVTLRSLIDLPGAPSVAEDGSSYLENARTKALAIARWSGQNALADDSGLEVDALDGAPGIHSARYAGTAQDSRANVAKLLRALAGVPEPRRTARFRCVLVVARPDGQTLAVEGSCEGRITEHEHGTAGFGYDPVFFYPPAGRTFAELPAALKHQVSHRGSACASLRGPLLDFIRDAIARRSSVG